MVLFWIVVAVFGAFFILYLWGAAIDADADRLFGESYDDAISEQELNDWLRSLS